MVYDKIKIYMELVEIKAKLASIFPFLLGIMFSYYRFGKIDLCLSVILVIAMFLFNMSVDMIDNYCDYKNASAEHDYKKKTNIIGRENLDLKKVFIVIAIFVLISAIMGIYLVYETDWILLLFGIYSFAVGIFYSAGPKPISSLPLGEFFSGTTMGFVIVLITVAVNVGGFHNLNYMDYAQVFVFSVPSMFAIAALMLTNNICDIKEDIINGRNTLAGILGLKNSVKLLYIFYGIAFFGVIVDVVLKLAPLTYLITLICIVRVFKNAAEIEMVPVKNRSFRYAIKNLGMILLLQSVGYAIGLLI